MINVNYPEILDLISDYNITGRTESAAFLMWYLENYYRLENQDCIDTVCDQSGDKGVDGIYVNDANGTIDIFQTKISQNPSKTIGDTVLKEFSGTLLQFASKENLRTLVDSAGNAQIVGLINRLDLLNKLDAYSIRGLFISNINLDINGQTFLSSESKIEFIGKDKLESTYISTSKEIPPGSNAKFDISGINVSKHFVDSKTQAIIAPIKASELVAMTGIED